MAKQKLTIPQMRKMLDYDVKQEVPDTTKEERKHNMWFSQKDVIYYMKNFEIGSDKKNRKV